MKSCNLVPFHQQYPLHQESRAHPRRMHTKHGLVTSSENLWDATRTAHCPGAGASWQPHTLSLRKDLPSSSILNSRLLNYPRFRRYDFTVSGLLSLNTLKANPTSKLKLFFKDELPNYNPAPILGQWGALSSMV